jgi:hypothetical protein
LPPFNDFKIKIVVAFTHSTLTLRQIDTAFRRDVVPTMNSRVDTAMGVLLDAGFVITPVIEIYERHSKKIIYVKYYFTANTRFANTRLKTDIEALTDLLETDIHNYLRSIRVTDVDTHNHRYDVTRDRIDPVLENRVIG